MSKQNAIVFFVLSLFSGGGALGSDKVERSFPFRADAAAGEGWLLPDAAAMEELAGLDAVRLVGFPSGEGQLASLDLKRISFANSRFFVDGAPASDALKSFSLWEGKIDGAENATVFLALSPYGSRGWVKTDGKLLHLLAFPDAAGDWSRSRALLLGEEELRNLGVAPQLLCQAGSIASPRAPALPLPQRQPAGGGTVAGGSLLPFYEARAAIETDYQFFQIFGNLPAAEGYLLALLGAVSARYREQVGTILTYPYIGLHTSSNDGWTTQESGGGTYDLLLEFQNAWDGGGGPVSADLYHFVSGAGLGGGIAYLPGLCDQDYGFAVSANIDAQTPFPIAQGPLNWDFMVVAHEFGHNFGSPHTHDFCPPLDECAPSGYFGPCQTQEVCTDQGTIMSYCHLCSGGLSNITTYFHPECVNLMRPLVESSCLLPFQGILGETDLGFAKPGSNGTPALDITWNPSPEIVTFSVTSAPANEIGILVVSPFYAGVPLFGGTLVPDLTWIFGLNSGPTASISFKIYVSPVSVPEGVVLYNQAWFRDGTGFASTNGVQFELILQ